MAEANNLPVSEVRESRVTPFWFEPLIGLGIGALGGALQSVLLSTSMIHDVLYGALFGAVFGCFFARRATSVGAGLIWGIAAALLVWIVFHGDWGI